MKPRVVIDPPFIVIDGHPYILIPADDATQRFEEISKKLMEEYADVWKRLAE